MAAKKKRVPIYPTEQQYEDIKEAAESIGLSFSAYCVMQAHKQAKKDNKQ